MTIEQTVEITERGVLHLEFPLPPEIPVGASVNVTVTAPVIPSGDFFGPRMSAREAIEMGRGIAKRLGSTFTSKRLLETRREDMEKEEAKYRRMFHKDEGIS